MWAIAGLEKSSSDEQGAGLDRSGQVALPFALGPEQSRPARRVVVMLATRCAAISEPSVTLAASFGAIRARRRSGLRPRHTWSQIVVHKGDRRSCAMVGFEHQFDPPADRRVSPWPRWLPASSSGTRPG